MSLRIAYLPDSSSMIRPIATPATGVLSGTPASIIASDPPQTEAIDDEPLDSRMSEPTAALERLVAHHLFLEFLEDGLRFGPPLDLSFGDARDQLLEDLVDAVVVLELAFDPHRLAERNVDLLLDLAVEFLADFLFLDFRYPLSAFPRERLDAGDDVPDRVVRALERLDHLLFGDFLRARFDHDDGVLSPA